VDAEGRPIEGVQVTFSRYDGGEHFYERPVVTAADGEFHFANGPLDGVTLDAKKEGYQWWYDEIGQAASRSRKEGVTITLTRCPVVTGVVTDASTGEPVPGATVYCMFPADRVAADEHGRYTMTMYCGRAVRFAASAPGLSTHGLVGAVARDNEVTELDLSLEPSTPIVGKVVDSRTMQPIAGARVAVGLGLPPRDPDEPAASVLAIPGQEEKIEIPEGIGMMDVLQGFMGSAIEAVTDAEGVFTIPLSFAEIVALRVSVDGYLEQSFNTEGDFSRPYLLKLDEGQVIAGRVVSPDGEPVAGLVVECQYGNLHLEATTDDDGRFRFGGLWAWGYLLRAEEPGRDGRGVLRGVVFGDERVVDDIELRLLDPMHVSGKITDENGQPFSDCYVHLSWREPRTAAVSLTRLADGGVAGGSAEVEPDGT
jgi:hypothetical protein